MERWLDGSPARTLGKSREVILFEYRTAMVIPIMEVRAPRGEMVIYESSPRKLNAQCEAIRAFMEEHRHG